MHSTIGSTAHSDLWTVWRTVYAQLWRQHPGFEPSTLYCYRLQPDGMSHKSHYPANTRHWTIVVSMLVHRLRRWPNIDTTVVQCLVLAGYSTHDAVLFTNRPLRYERVYLPLGKVADTPFHISLDHLCYSAKANSFGSLLFKWGGHHSTSSWSIF